MEFSVPPLSNDFDVNGNGDADGNDVDAERRQHAFTLQTGSLLTALPDCSIQIRMIMTTLIDLIMMMMR